MSRQVVVSRALPWAMAVALGIAGRAEAGDGSVRPFGMVGIARGETARLGIVNVLPAVQAGESRRCQIVLSFLDPDGSVLVGRDGFPIRSIVTLAPGRSAFLDVAFDDASLVRTQIRASVEFRKGCPSDPTAIYIPGVEVFETETGRTSFVMGPSPHMLPAPRGAGDAPEPGVGSR